jgi:hypothetical protein
VSFRRRGDWCRLGLPLVAVQPFPRLDVSQWERDKDEPAGDEAKFWLLEPGADPEVKWLFKTVTRSESGHVCGEDWAEKAAAEVAGLIAVPCARIELAVRDGESGCISRSLLPRPPERTLDLQHGMLYLLDQGVDGYEPGKVDGRPGHSLENICAVLARSEPPPGCVLPFEATGFDVFAGYVVLDALIANRDRHDENWAVLLPGAGEGPVRVCGSYDHANCLGYNLTDAARQRLLKQRGGVEEWCGKGTAWRFAHDPKPPGKPRPPIQTLVEAAARALSLASAAARDYWPSQLEGVPEDAFRGVVSRLPELSEPARTFAAEVLIVNRRRILRACA